MQYLKGKGIPKIEQYIEEENYSIMIMELLGKSLETLMKETDEKIYPKDNRSFRSRINTSI